MADDSSLNGAHTDFYNSNQMNRQRRLYQGKARWLFSIKKKFVELVPRLRRDIERLQDTCTRLANPGSFKSMAKLPEVPPINEHFRQPERRRDGKEIGSLVEPASFSLLRKINTCDCHKLYIRFDHELIMECLLSGDNGSGKSRGFVGMDLPNRFITVGLMKGIALGNHTNGNNNEKKSKRLID